ncbi:hypothetical protein TGAM01_v206841 [Trichoderma gamsii]|uniref:FMN-dependent dehydrogenase domain-containing protein n=1 Tax=Trichoderma gamsii TaxID=398673 RepID=A0A2P4ZIQ6_9HYPO|nr:hypothetical protein TGAM01_v206841 [Trichoderma gamsii]PON24153.1 hypothetical protein TGAM01_v206841 [Trichoderma gamsii]
MVDSPTVGRRLNELRNGTDLSEHLIFPNVSYGPKNFKNAIRDAAVSASEYLPWLSSITLLDMEIWLKGIYTPEDVITVAQYPLVKEIVISNHGVASLTVLRLHLKLYRLAQQRLETSMQKRSPENHQ